jgi:ERCC4-related helicase
MLVQQAEVFRIHTHFEVRHFVGSMGVDFWDRAQWRREIEGECDVFVMTPQILLNILNHGFIKASTQR